MSFIEMTGITKTFSGIKALDGVDFDVRGGEIHGLAGANGAGKTALAHILAGITTPDSGGIAIDGSPAAIKSVADSQRLGIGVAYQEGQMIGGVSAGQYLMLGREPSGRFGVISEHKTNEAAREFLGKIGVLDIPVELSASSLSESRKKFIEAARAILVGTKAAVFDEPAARLTPDETGRMAELIRRAAQGGAAVILISHDIPFVMGLCGRVTVLREGRRVGTFDTDGTNADDIARYIGEPPALFPTRTETKGGVVFSEPKTGIEIRAGETVGIRIPDGSLKTEIIGAIFGAEPRNSGDVSIFGVTMRMGPPGGAVRHRVGLSADERKLRNSALYITIRKKTAYARFEHTPIRLGGESPLGSLFGGGQSDPLRETAAMAQNLFEPSDAPEGRSPGELMFGGVDAVIFDEPARGTDETARTEIYRLMNELARRGKGIILFSLDGREIDGMCDRIALDY